MSALIEWCVWRYTRGWGGAGVLRDIQEDALPAVGIVYKEIGKEGADVLGGFFAPHGAVRTDGECFTGVEVCSMRLQEVANAHGVVGGVGSMEAMRGVDVNAYILCEVFERECLWGVCATEVHDRPVRGDDRGEMVVHIHEAQEGLINLTCRVRAITLT